MVIAPKLWGRRFVPLPMHRDTSFVQHRPQLEPLDDIERFLASLRFEQRGKLEQLGIEIESIE
jgi:hypothetical protein